MTRAKLCQPRTSVRGSGLSSPRERFISQRRAFSPGETNTTTLTFGRMPQSGLEPETGAVCRVIGVSVDGIGCPDTRAQSPEFTSRSVHAGLKTRSPGLKSGAGTDWSKYARMSSAGQLAAPKYAQTPNPGRQSRVYLQSTPIPVCNHEDQPDSFRNQSGAMQSVN